MSEVKVHGMPLCPSNLDPANFLKVDGKSWIVALDFTYTCFLPPSFFAYALTEGKYVAWLNKKRISYPKSTQLMPMGMAAGALIVFGTNKIGESNLFLFHC